MAWGNPGYPQSGGVTIIPLPSGALEFFGPDGASLGTVTPGGATAPLTLPEIGSPGTPGSGVALVYAKSDGRIYSKGPGGTEYGPFDVAGTPLSAFRLSGVADSPASIALGTYGDEFEYSTLAALQAVWTGAHGSGKILAPAGSSFLLGCPDPGGPEISGQGIYIPATVPTNCEIAALFDLQYSDSMMLGLGMIDALGNGPVGVPYLGGSYIWNMVTWGENGHGAAGAAVTGPLTGVPFWLALRKQVSNYRLRWSPDGATWHSLVANEAHVVTPAAFWLGGMYNTIYPSRINRFVYGSPDLGLG